MKDLSQRYENKHDGVFVDHVLDLIANWLEIFSLSVQEILVVAVRC